MAKSKVWAVKCPVCGCPLPEPTLSEIRVGSCVWKDHQIGVPELAWISKCSSRKCGFLFCQKEKHLTKYPTMYADKRSS